VIPLGSHSYYVTAEEGHFTFLFIRYIHFFAFSIVFFFFFVDSVWSLFCDSRLFCSFFFFFFLFGDSILFGQMFLFCWFLIFIRCVVDRSSFLFFLRCFHFFFFFSFIRLRCSSRLRLVLPESTWFFFFFFLRFFFFFWRSLVLDSGFSLSTWFVFFFFFFLEVWFLDHLLLSRYIGRWRPDFFLFVVVRCWSYDRSCLHSRWFTLHFFFTFDCCCCDLLLIVVVVVVRFVRRPTILRLSLILLRWLRCVILHRCHSRLILRPRCRLFLLRWCCCSFSFFPTFYVHFACVYTILLRSALHVRWFLHRVPTFAFWIPPGSHTIWILTHATFFFCVDFVVPGRSLFDSILPFAFRSLFVYRIPLISFLIFYHNFHVCIRFLIFLRSTVLLLHSFVCVYVSFWFVYRFVTVFAF